MDTSKFDYNLPENLIAQNPPDKRGGSRLLVLDKDSGAIDHKMYVDIPQYIQKDDVVILNNTKVIQARTFPIVKRTGRKVEVLFLEDRGNDIWYVLIGRARHVKVGDLLNLDDYLIEIISRPKGETGFLVKVSEPETIMNKFGHVPLPAYIKRSDVDSDKNRYNTVFGSRKGSVAAPTASLNLTDDIIKGIHSNGARIGYIDLQIGWGTFAPVNTEKVEDFKIHSEVINVPKSTVDLVNNCKGRVWAFGTTAVRALESVAIADGKIKETSGDKSTDIFIYPGYKFKMVDVLVTNFHAPRSSLIMLVSAFAGRSTILNAYSEAIDNKYDFLSYGDSMLII